MPKRSRFEQRTLKLAENHGWKCKPGYKIFVMGRGAVRFDFPGHWKVLLPEKQDEVSVKFHDLAPPKDNVRLEVSYLLLNPAIDFSDLPLIELFREVTRSPDHPSIWESEIHQERRADGIELVWQDRAFMDPVEHREGCSRACLGRGNSVQPFITFDYWPEDAERFLPVWTEVVRTLQLGQYVKDPTKPRRYN
jgi:hypothetical protein